MLVDTNTVDKTVTTDRGTVRILIVWKNVDGESDEVVRVLGTCSGMTEPVSAEWHRARGSIKTRFSAPVLRPAEFIACLLSMARKLSVPEETSELFAKAMEDLSSKAYAIE